MTTDQDAADGWELPGYRIGQVIGRGGFATVYQAEQLSLKRQVAIKVLLADLGAEADRRRFDRERDLLSRLGEHPCVVDVYDAGVSPERRPFIVMRLYRQGSLADRLAREGALDPAETVLIVGRLAAALDAAHAQNVLHRDVKPGNVLLTDAGEPVLSDFGIAGLRDGGPAARDRSSTSFFTVSHAAPEVLEQQAFSVASDVYALASTTYELLAGHPPFPGVGPRTLAKILDEPPPALHRPDVPPAVEAVIRQGLAKNPMQRPPSAGAFATALAAALHSPAAPAPPMPPVPPVPPPAFATPPAPSPATRSTSTRLVAGLAVAALVAVVVVVSVARAWTTRHQGSPPAPGIAAPSESSASAPAVTGSASEAGATGTAASGAGLLAATRTISVPAVLGQLAVDSKTGNVAAARTDGTVHVWDPSTGRLLRTFAADSSGNSHRLAFSRDGTVLVGVGYQARIWRSDGSAAPRPLVIPRDGPFNFTDVAISGDGRRLITAAALAGQPLQVWDVASGALVGKIDLPDQVLALDVAPDGRTVLALTQRRIAVLEFGGQWDPAAVTTRWIALASPLPDPEGDLAVSPDGRTIAATAADGYVTLYDLASGAVTGTLAAEGAVFSKSATLIAFSPDGTSLATADFGHAEVWNVADRTLKTRLDTGKQDLHGLVFGSGGRTLVGQASGGATPPTSVVSIWTMSS